MGTCSYVLTGTEKGFSETFGTTCHGAVSKFLHITNFSQIVRTCPHIQGRAMSRAKSRRNLGFEQVLEELKQKGISIRVASPKLVMEEAPESYKNVTDVVNTCRRKDYQDLYQLSDSFRPRSGH